MSQHGSSDERRDDHTRAETPVERAESSSDRRGSADGEHEETRQDGDRNGNQSSSNKDEEEQGGEPKAYVPSAFSRKRTSLARVCGSC